MIDYNYDNLLEKKVSVLIDSKKKNGTDESYVGLFVKQGKDFIELYLDLQNRHFLERIIISKKVIKSIWIYTENT